MAHFAEVENGLVKRVLVVPNEHEENGQEYLNNLGITGTWIQCSYNANIRGKFPTKGDVYNESLDRFEPPRPYKSWTFDEEFYDYVPTVARPEAEGFWIWNESKKIWEEDNTF